MSSDAFRFSGRVAPLSVAFISPHLDFRPITEHLRRLAGGSGGPLYKPTGNTWSSVVVQVFSPDLIEAARAGEAGKGFAVVANEVKKLDNDTKSSQNRTQEAISAMEVSISTLGNNIETAQGEQRYHDIASQIAEMSATSATMEHTLASIGRIVSAQRSTVSEISSAVEALRRLG